MIVAPILFSGPMVRALLAGRKTQTRRLAWGEAFATDAPRDGWRCEGGQYRKPSPWKKLHDRWQAGERDVVIWVRERCLCQWNPVHEIRQWAYYADAATARDHTGLPIEWAHGERDYCPGIHMPRSVSRLTLVVTDIRVERLRGISEGDAIAEGIIQAGPPDADGRRHFNVEGGPWDEPTAARAYRALWDSLNGDRAPWSGNPECVAITFRPIAINIDAHLRERT